MLQAVSRVTRRVSTPSSSINWAKFTPTRFKRTGTLDRNGVVQNGRFSLQGTIGGKRFEVAFGNDPRPEPMGYPLGRGRPNTHNQLQLGEIRELRERLRQLEATDALRPLMKGSDYGDFVRLLERPLTVAAAKEAFRSNARAESSVIDAAGVDLTTQTPDARKRREMYTIGEFEAGRLGTVQVLSVSMRGREGLVSALFVARPKVGPDDRPTGVELVRVS